MKTYSKALCLVRHGENERRCIWSAVDKAWWLMDGWDKMTSRITKPEWKNKSYKKREFSPWTSITCCWGLATEEILIDWLKRPPRGRRPPREQEVSVSDDRWQASPHINHFVSLVPTTTLAFCTYQKYAALLCVWPLKMYNLLQRTTKDEDNPYLRKVSTGTVALYSCLTED